MAARSIASRCESLRKWFGELHRLGPFDPEHLLEEILLSEAFYRRFPDPLRVSAAVADSAAAKRRGVRRYRFHGCLAYVKEAWTDMRPLGLRRKMDQQEK
jgi:hypothetical protein